MKHNASTLGRRAAVTAGVLTLAVLGLAPMAQAEDANYGDINTEALGSLTIHKHLNGDGNPHPVLLTAPLPTTMARVRRSPECSSRPTRSMGST